MNGILVLEDGRFFRGGRFGATAGAGGEGAEQACVHHIEQNVLEAAEVST